VFNEIQRKFIGVKMQGCKDHGKYAINFVDEPPYDVNKEFGGERVETLVCPHCKEVVKKTRYVWCGEGVGYIEELAGTEGS